MRKSRRIRIIAPMLTAMLLWRDRDNSPIDSCLSKYSRRNVAKPHYWPTGKTSSIFSLKKVVCQFLCVTKIVCIYSLCYMSNLSYHVDLQQTQQYNNNNTNNNNNNKNATTSTLTTPPKSTSLQIGLAEN